MNECIRSDQGISNFNLKSTGWTTAMRNKELVPKYGMNNEYEF